MFVWTNAHIEGHFATCFTALVLIRLLQTKLGSRYPIGKTIESLRKYNCMQIDTTLYQFVYYDEILEECEKVFGLELNNFSIVKSGLYTTCRQNTGSLDFTGFPLLLV